MAFLSRLNTTKPYWKLILPKQLLPKAKWFLIWNLKHRYLYRFGVQAGITRLLVCVIAWASGTQNYANMIMKDGIPHPMWDVSFMVYGAILMLPLQLTKPTSWAARG